MKVAEMRMLRWMCRHTRINRIRNEDIQAKVGVAPWRTKCGKGDLDGGHVKRRNTDTLIRRCERLALVGLRRGRGRTKKCWGEVIRQDMASLQLTDDITFDRIFGGPGLRLMPKKKTFKICLFITSVKPKNQEMVQLC
ncbi:uncharacterized protein LOC142174892 [Nicotiana tabacum]|uniref:Uncharacterized protein LOC142174892 n=1 Tax=Nicotiana tabacum TaxID=4097 RepID=A0AC58TJH1_TOBAC